MKTIYCCGYCDYKSEDMKDVEDHEKGHFRYRYLVEFRMGPETDFKWSSRIRLESDRRIHVEGVSAKASVTVSMENGKASVRQAVDVRFSGSEAFGPAMDKAVGTFSDLWERDPDARDLDGLKKAVDALSAEAAGLSANLQKGDLPGEICMTAG